MQSKDAPDPKDPPHSPTAPADPVDPHAWVKPLSAFVSGVPAPRRSAARHDAQGASESTSSDSSAHTKKLARRLGGKAANLVSLMAGAFPVPKGWVIEARHFQDHVDRIMPRGHDIGSLVKLARSSGGMERAGRARDRMLESDLPEGLAQALGELWENIKNEAPWGLAVRSSATCEDTYDTSLAGLATTELGVRGKNALEKAVKQVWSSLFLPRALSYLAMAGVKDAQMAVVIQPVVKAGAAGVVFTAPPWGLEGEQWRLDERLVNVTLGLGAPVVEGAAVTDSVRLAKSGGAVRACVLAHKSKALVVGEHGLEEIDVAEERAKAPALSDGALRELSGIVGRLESWAEGPLDIEFAAEEDDGSGRRRQIWLLQVRPMRGQAFPAGGDAETVWSRTNLSEALPGAGTPLTWSIAQSFSEKGFREAFGALGCKVPKGEVLVGNIQGRFYLNLTAFMRISAQVPGLTPQALLSMSGGANPAAIAALERQVHGISKRAFYTKLPVLAARLLARQAKLEREADTFEVDAAKSRKSLLEMDLSILPDDALATTLKSALALLDRTGTLMLHCASASLAAHLGLCKALEKTLGLRASSPASSHHAAATLRSGQHPADRASHIAQALVGGVLSVDSAAPGLALSNVADAVNEDPRARELLLSGKLRSADELPTGKARDALIQFFDEHGDRAVREAEIATPRWREEPAQVIAMLSSAMRAPAGEAQRALARARALADREMAQLEMYLTAPELWLIRSLSARTQRFTRLRERMRTWVTRVLGMLRIIALDVDRRLLRIDPSLPPGSVFFCTHDELIAALRSGRADVGSVVRLRLSEHARDAARPDPPATFIGRPPKVVLPPEKGERLVGLSASAGVVEGRARVLAPGAQGLDTVSPGEILISRTTDVGLSPLFLVAAAVVTELGGPLSHAAVVAREYGIPAVVSVPGVTAALKTGDWVRVDGDRGWVEKLGDPPLAVRDQQ